MSTPSESAIRAQPELPGWMSALRLIEHELIIAHLRHPPAPTRTAQDDDGRALVSGSRRKICVETWCGLGIERGLVLDLEQYREDADAAAAFIGRYAQNVRVISALPEIIRTKNRGSGVDRRRAMKRAQKVAAQRGCNVVLVLAAWEGEDNAAVALPLATGQSIAVGLHHAYARVLMASGEHTGGESR